MILELPKKFHSRSVICKDYMLEIYKQICCEDLMYSLAKALRGTRCIYCGKKLGRSDYTLDHRYPRSTGGISITNNLFQCCDFCNSVKGNLTHEEYLSTMNISNEEKKIFREKILENNERIIETIGFKLPDEWVEYENTDKVKYIDFINYKKGKKYNCISEFYKLHHKIPRPIIVDKNFHLLEGYNIVLFAKENGISKLPMSVLENVERKV